MKKLWLLILLSFIPALIAAEEAEQEPEADDKKVTEQTEPAPQATNLRSRDLGEAFKNFQPSEEISADNAVTFPVDI